jgi:excisionase family DNA binding protein
VEFAVEFAISIQEISMNDHTRTVPSVRVIDMTAEQLALMINAVLELQFRRIKDELVIAPPKKFADGYLSRAETAQMLGISLQTLGRHVRENGLTMCKLGQRVVFRASDIESFLTKHERTFAQ